MIVPRNRPAINAQDLDLPSVTSEAWTAFSAANDPPTVFRYGDGLTRIENDENRRPVLRPMNQDRLRYSLARAADWYKRTNRGRSAALPPLHVVRDMLATPDPPLPILRRVVASPVFSADGTIHTVPGYDSRTGLYYSPSPGFSVPPVPEEPDDDEIAHARALIFDELLSDFPFVDDADRAHAIALFFLPFVREFIDGPTPLHLIEKPSPGTGASLLVQVLTLPAVGHAPPVMTEALSEEEWRKRITAKLVRAPAILLIDNLRRRLDSAAVSAAITSEVWEDRWLGHSETLHLPVRCAWIATGNNPALSNEMARRTVRVRLDAGVERPWLRNGFRHPDLQGWVVSHRGDLVWSALTLGRTWMMHYKRLAGSKTLGMFDSWARVLGGLLRVAGVRGFLTNLEALYDASDAESRAWQGFVEAWWQKFGGADVGVADLWPLAASVSSELIELGPAADGVHGQRIRLGKALGRMRDRLFGHWRIADAGTKQGAQRWRLVASDGRRP
jgi:hypothetical protein